MAAGAELKPERAACAEDYEWLARNAVPPPGDPALAAYREAVRRLSAIRRSTAAPEKALRIEAPVPGLYESIPLLSRGDSVSRGAYLVEVFGHQDSRLVEISEPGKTFGEFTRDYLPNQRMLYFSGSSLSRDGRAGPTALPTFLDLPGTVPLVPGRGVPTQVFATLVAMRSFGVPYGSLARARTNYVENLRTSLQLMRAPALQRWRAAHPNQLPPLEVLSEAIRDTHTARYMESALVQAGHRVSAARVIERGIYWEPLYRVLRSMEKNLDDESLALLVQEWKADGSPLPFSPNELVPLHFGVELDLAPSLP